MPKELEQQWEKEIKKNLLKDIAIEKGNRKVISIGNYIGLLDCSSAVCFLIEILKENDFDTFSLIILAEQLKYYLSRNIFVDLKEEINNTLLRLKNFMLKNEITIDESYKMSPYLKIMIFQNRKYRQDKLMLAQDWVEQLEEF